MPGKLVSMKMTKKEAKAEMESVSVDTPEYPWGLSINLDTESLEKLGIDKLPQVGDKMSVLAKVEVTRASSESSIHGKDRKNVSLQITDMSVGPEIKDRDIGKSLYGGED